MLRICRVVAVGLVLLSTDARAQALPDGRDSWALHVVTSGGITGTGRGNVTLSSDGGLTCSGRRAPGECPSRVPPGAIEDIAKMLRAVDVAAWAVQPVSTCSDCFKTTVTLRRSEPDGVRTYVAEWDESQIPPAPLRNLVEALAALSHAPVR